MSVSGVHDYECQVRWSDVDAYGHVNNVKYFEYFQESRISFITDMGARGDEVNHFVVAKLVVDYKRPIFFRREPYLIRSVLTRIGTSSFDIVARILHGDQTLSQATAVIVTIDPGTGRARPLPDQVRRSLEAYLPP